MMRASLSLAAVAVIFLGLWLIASGFMESAPTPTAHAQQVIAAPRETASPVMLGSALLAGGVVLFILILRRR